MCLVKLLFENANEKCEDLCVFKGKYVKCGKQSKVQFLVISTIFLLFEVFKKKHVKNSSLVNILKPICHVWENQRWPDSCGCRETAKPATVTSYNIDFCENVLDQWWENMKTKYMSTVGQRGSHLHLAALKAHVLDPAAWIKGWQGYIWQRAPRRTCVQSALRAWPRMNLNRSVKGGLCVIFSKGEQSGANVTK